MSRKYLKVVTPIAGVCVAVATLSFGTAVSQVRVEPTYGQHAKPSEGPLQPQQTFDSVAAVQALERGSSSIQGVACSYHKNLYFEAAGKTVHLLPVTPYLEEWLALRKKAGRGQAVPLSNEAFAARIDTTTDAKGRFRFPDLKPGGYYIFVQFSFNQQKTGDFHAGTGYGPYGTTAYYERRDYLVARDDVLEKVVKIDREGQMVKTAVRNAGFFKGGLLGKLAPCVGGT